MKTTTLILGSLAALAATAAGLAQSDIVPSKPQSRPIAVINAVIHTATAENPVIENGHVLFDGGRIMSVGPGAPTLPEGCEVVDPQRRGEVTPDEFDCGAQPAGSGRPASRQRRLHRHRDDLRLLGR